MKFEKLTLQEQIELARYELNHQYIYNQHHEI